MGRQGRLRGLFEDFQGLKSDGEYLAEHEQKVHGRRTGNFECQGPTEADGPNLVVECRKVRELHCLRVGQKRQGPAGSQPIQSGFKSSQGHPPGRIQPYEMRK